MIKVYRVLQAIRGLLDKRVIKDRKVILEDLVQVVPQVTRALRERLVVQDHLVLRVLRATRVHRVLQDHLDRKVILELLVPLVHLDHLVHQVIREFRVIRVAQDKRVIKVLQVQLAHPVIKVFQELLV